MAFISSIDGPNRRIYLHADTVSLTTGIPLGVYQEMRALRRTNENLRKYDLFMRAEGRVSKGGGKFTERYFVLLDGTRIVPYDATHELDIDQTIITDTGEEGPDCFDRAPLSVGVEVDINYTPPQVEVIEITTGGGVGTPAEVAAAVWNALKSSYNNANTMGEKQNQTATEDDVIVHVNSKG